MHADSRHMVGLFFDTFCVHATFALHNIAFGAPRNAIFTGFCCRITNHFPTTSGETTAAFILLLTLQEQKERLTQRQGSKNYE